MAKFRELSKWEIMSKAADHFFLVFLVSFPPIPLSSKKQNNANTALLLWSVC